MWYSLEAIWPVNLSELKGILAIQDPQISQAALIQF